ncbi:hypothetical protein N7519_011209 [Penicillium mononematosum]|uniref:uncharacterized protein n=1 Tax=Penicillium mononematosum TaxID=268346 RepID=UPI0025492D48|nr:uncharacterized protein N7519_011209 [Penicillium mononematosum]KAJ6180748.1 hypothetical protein N7519_011209 [Penicillium mononematosum]
MPGSDDDRPERRRRDRSQDSQDDHYSSSRRRDQDRRSSHRDSPRRRSSRSPAERTSRRSDRDRPRRERRERSSSLAGEDRRRHRHRSHRHHDTRDEYEARSSRRHRRTRSRSRSRSPQRSRSPPPRALERRGPLPSQSDAFTDVAHPSDAPAPEKQKPNFNPTGRLAAESNTIQVQGGTEIVLKYHEPPEARKPPPQGSLAHVWQDLLETVELSERSCWLVGRERMVVDFPLDHPSCSKQHAVLQFRFVEKRNEYGDRIGKVKPYLIDLESANGSSVNGETIPGGRYVEVMDKDVIRFGLSSREYVLMLPPS